MLWILHIKTSFVQLRQVGCKIRILLKTTGALALDQRFKTLALANWSALTSLYQCLQFLADHLQIYLPFLWGRNDLFWVFTAGKYKQFLSEITTSRLLGVYSAIIDVAAYVRVQRKIYLLKYVSSTNRQVISFQFNMLDLHSNRCINEYPEVIIVKVESSDWSKIDLQDANSIRRLIKD